MVNASTTELTPMQVAADEVRRQKQTAERELRNYLRDLACRRTVRRWDDLTPDEKSDAAAILISEMPEHIAAEFLNESMALEDSLDLLLKLVERPGITPQQNFALRHREHAIDYAESFVNEQLEVIHS